MRKDFTDQIKRSVARCDALQSKVLHLEGEIKTLVGQVERDRNRIQDIEERSIRYAKAIEVLDLAQRAVSDNIRDGFESIVTFALQYILGDGYSFKLVFSRRGPYQEVDFNIITPEMKNGSDLLETEAGGVLDIVSLVLRVAILELHRPYIEGPIILDECFKHLSSNHLDGASNFLRALKEKINRQIIMVTHKETYFAPLADKAIEIQKIG